LGVWWSLLWVFLDLFVVFLCFIVRVADGLCVECFCIGLVDMSCYKLWVLGEVIVCGGLCGGCLCGYICAGMSARVCLLRYVCAGMSVLFVCYLHWCLFAGLCVSLWVVFLCWLLCGGMCGRFLGCLFRGYVGGFWGARAGIKRVVEGFVE